VSEADLWLLAGIVAFYLYDATILLYADELVAWPRRRAWSASVGNELQWRGRFAFLPNPLTPWRPLLRLQWERPPGDRAPVQLGEVHDLVRALKPLRAAVAVMAFLLAVLLPLVLFGWRRWEALLLLLGAVYLLSSCMVVYTLRARAALGLDRRALLSLAVDTLACPPFALNLVRKISLRHVSRMDGLAFATATLAPADLRRLHRQLLPRLQALLLREPGDSPRAEQLRACQAQLQLQSPEQQDETA